MAGDGAGQRAEDRAPAADLHGRPHARLRAHRAAVGLRLSAAYRVTIRRSGRVERERHATLDAAVEALEARLDGLALSERRRPAQLLGRTYEPVRQVAARGEIAGPGRLRAGVDLRGDGSAEAFTGRWRRRLLPAQPGETAYDALRRALAAPPP